MLLRQATTLRFVNNSLVRWRSRGFHCTVIQFEDKRQRDPPPRALSDVAKAKKLFSAKHYEKIGTKTEKLLRADQERQIAIKMNKEEERQQKRQKQQQFLIDKQASVLTKGAMKRKISAIAKWAQREHPDIWQHIVSKISLKESLQGHPWEPAVLLSYEEMEEMKELRQQDANKWRYPKLGHKYGISAVAAAKIVTSKFSPTPEQRVTRWLEREEFKRIQERFLRSVAKAERAKLIEADLKTRYGSLYSPPPKMEDPLVQKLTETKSVEDSDQGEEDEYDSDDEPVGDSHAQELSTVGGLTSVYRRITAEAKAVVAAKLENNPMYQKAYAKDINRIQRQQHIEKEKKAMLEEQEKDIKPQRTFFNVFDSDEEGNNKRKSSLRKPMHYKELDDKPWRQKHILSRKSTRIKQWPEDLPVNTRKTSTNSEPV